YGTTLPANAYDGQEAVLVDSTTNPTYQWRFRYNAASTSAYKWEFIGGTSVVRRVTAQESTGSTSPVDLTTVGPQVTVLRAGDYSVRWGAQMSSPNGGNWCAMVISGQSAAGAAVVTVPGNGYSAFAAVESTVTGVSAGATIKAQYQTFFAGQTAQFNDRFIAVTPLRVA